MQLFVHKGRVPRIRILLCRSPVRLQKKTSESPLRGELLDTDSGTREAVATAFKDPETFRIGKMAHFG